MRVMISQPMKGLSTEEIREQRAAVVAKLEAEGHQVWIPFSRRRPRKGIIRHCGISANRSRRFPVWMPYTLWRGGIRRGGVE